jgi:hypothetical protein
MDARAGHVFGCLDFDSTVVGRMIDVRAIGDGNRFRFQAGLNYDAGSQDWAGLVGPFVVRKPCYDDFTKFEFEMRVCHSVSPALDSSARMTWTRSNDRHFICDGLRRG